MSRLKHLDWSTINKTELAKLPVYQLPATYRLQDDCGNGCAGDPPGFPTYFTRAVYTSQGNNPLTDYEYVIAGHGIGPVKWKNGETWEKRQEEAHALFLRLWNKPPLDHPRVQAWIRATFSHHRHCYQVPELRAQGKNWHDAMVIWPGGTLGKTPFGDLKKEEFEIGWAKEHQSFDKWKHEEQVKFLQDIQENNKRVARMCEAVAIPENHDGTIIVRRYYPEFNPTPELISAKFPKPGNWWETMSECPKPENCPGQYGSAHPANGSWCQMCGWHAEETKAAA